MPRWTLEQLAAFKARTSQPYAPTLPTAAQIVAQPVKRGESTLETKFREWWKLVSGPELVTQHRFHTARRWRFDFSHPATLVAVELEGGTFGMGKPCPSCGQRRQGGHSRGKHFAEDCEKYNTATRMGWRVFRLTGAMITIDNLTQIKEFIQKRA